jgi:SPP1 gp7 family putative phage head morphogenesis protein
MPPKKQSFHRPQRIELSYQRTINNFLQRYLKFSPLDTLASITQRLASLASNPKFLEAWATGAARRMVTMTKVANAKSWREAAAKSSQGRAMYKALREELQGPTGIRVQEIIHENAKLISSIPDKLQESVAREIASMQQKGLRPETITAHLRKRIPQLTRSRVALIARTEASKASTALTRARSEDIGIKWYKWSTSHDSRVRQSHRRMEDVLVAWSDPPNPETLIHERNDHGPYHAGDIYNCRCVPLPIVSLDLISFPAKVYHRGRIEMMSRKRFTELLA